MNNKSISDWVLKEIESLNNENNELIEWKSDMHPHPSAMSNMCRLQKSNECRAKIEAYIKLLDFMAVPPAEGNPLPLPQDGFKQSIPELTPKEKAIQKTLEDIKGEQVIGK